MIYGAVGGPQLPLNFLSTVLYLITLLHTALCDKTVIIPRVVLCQILSFYELYLISPPPPQHVVRHNQAFSQLTRPRDVLRCS